MDREPGIDGAYPAASLVTGVGDGRVVSDGGGLLSDLLPVWAARGVGYARSGDLRGGGAGYFAAVELDDCHGGFARVCGGGGSGGGGLLAAAEWADVGVPASGAISATGRVVDAEIDSAGKFRNRKH